MNEKIKDSGTTQEFSTGAHRDNATGKGRCDLLPLKQVASAMANDKVLLLIDQFMETRDTIYLANAIRASAETLSQFRFKNIVREFNGFGISINMPDEEYEADQKLAILNACVAHMMLEASKLYESGANKYGANNWKLGMPVNRYIDSGVRHYLKTIRGDVDEPHYRGFVWNILCAMWTAENIPELNYNENPVPSDKKS